MLTQAQLQTLAADIAADPAFATLPNNSDSSTFIADEYTKMASPDFFVWRTDVTREQIYHATSIDGTSWDWTTYKNQAIAEQNAWTQMFMGDMANFSLPNLRAGVAKIFTGSAPANAQAAHCLAIGKRRSNRGEKLLATGPGSGAIGSPANMTFEGTFSTQDIEAARTL